MPQRMFSIYQFHTVKLENISVKSWLGGMRAVCGPAERSEAFTESSTLEETYKITQSRPNTNKSSSKLYH